MPSRFNSERSNVYFSLENSGGIALQNGFCVLIRECFRMQMIYIGRNIVQTVLFAV